MRVKIARSARRHKVGNARMLHVMGTRAPMSSTRPSGEVELSWVGPDDRGVELEIVAVVAVDDRSGERVVLVIHCLPTALRG